MCKQMILTLLLSAFLVSLPAAQMEAAKTRVVDLTRTTANPADWKIMESRVGGSIGTWPVPPSYVPVTVHLTNCVMKDAELYFSVEIENDRKLEVQVPISMNSKLFDHRGVIQFRELFIRLGTAGNTEDATTFKNDP